MNSSSKRAASDRVFGSNARFFRENITSIAKLDQVVSDSPHCRHPTSSPSRSATRLSDEVKGETDRSRDVLDAPRRTPEMRQRTFIFSSSYIPPFSRRTATHTDPSLSPYLLASHAFGPPAPGYDFDDRLEAPHYAPSYYRALRALLYPASDASSTPDSLPELSTGSDISNNQWSPLSEDCDSPATPRMSPVVYDDRYQRSPSSEYSNSLATHSGNLSENMKEVQVLVDITTSSVLRQLSSEYAPTVCNLHERLSPAIDPETAFKHVLLDEDQDLTFPHINPPSDTFRSSHAPRLRSESHYTDARELERAKLNKKRLRISESSDMLTALVLETFNAYNEGRLKSGNHGGVSQEHKGRKGGDKPEGGRSEERKEDMDYRKIVIGTSESDIFGVGAMTENMSLHSSSPRKRSVSVHAPIP